MNSRTQAPDRNLALELVRTTEAAALAAARLVGKGDKNAADQAAVDAMRLVLALFAIADDRRRTTRCAQGCSHWWHGELSDVDAVLAALAPGMGPSHE